MVSFVLKINTSLVFFISIIDGFDYTMDYMENVARSFTKKYPSYLIHKKSEDKIKAFLTDRMKAKVENFVNAEAKNVTVTEVREIADLIAEYEGTEPPSPYGSHPADAPSLGSTGVELPAASIAPRKPKPSMNMITVTMMKPQMTAAVSLRKSFI